MIDWFSIRKFVKFNLWTNLIQVEKLNKLLWYFILLANKILEFKVILNDLISPSFDIVQKWTKFLTLITFIFFQKVEAILTSSKTTLQSCIWIHNFQPIEAAQCNCNIYWAIIPDVNSTLSLFRVIIFGEIIDQNSLNVSILSEEFIWSDHLFETIFSWDSDDIQ